MMSFVLGSNLLASHSSSYRAPKCSKSKLPPGISYYKLQRAGQRLPCTVQEFQMKQKRRIRKQQRQTGSEFSKK